MIDHRYDRMHLSVLKHRGVKIIQFLYLCSIAVAPLYFGGERMLSWGISGVLQSIILIALAILKPPSSTRPKAEKYLSASALTCIGIVMAWAAFQLMPISYEFLMHPVWSMTRDAIGEPVPGMIAVSPDEGFLTFVKITIVLLVFYNAYTLYQFRLDVYGLILAIPIIAISYAVVGMIWLRYSPETHIWLAYSPYQKNLVSTFVNRNSFAQYLGIASLCTLAYVTHIWKSKSVHISSFFRLQFYLKETFNVFAFSILLFGILLVCMLLTTSRAGIYSSFAGYAVFILAIIRIMKDRFVGTGFILIIFLAAGYILYAGNAGEVGQRNLHIADHYSGRIELYKVIWSLIQNRALTGYGLGGFEAAFRSYMPIDFDPFGIWHRAHNVYLDAAVALGIPAAGLALYSVLVPLIIHVKRAINRTSTISILVIAIYVQLSIHSLFDFGLQTGANAITIAAILGASLTHSTRRMPVNQ